MTADSALDLPARETVANATGTVLIVCSHVPDEINEWLSVVNGQAVDVLVLNEGAQPEPTIAGVRFHSISEMANQDEVREAFLEFMNEWPNQERGGELSFNKRFRVRGDYSLWWITVGADRHPNVGLFPEMRQVYAFDKAIRSISPTRVLLFLDRSELATAYASRCRQVDIDLGFLPGSALPSDPWRGRYAWCWRTLKSLALLPVKNVIRSAFARIMARTPSRDRATSAAPTIVYAWRNSDYFRVEDGRFDVWFWQAIRDAINVRLPDVQHAYLFRKWNDFRGHRKVGWLYHTLWPQLRSWNEAVPIPDRYAVLGCWRRELPANLRSVYRYSRLEGRTHYRQSMVFQGADIAGLLVPRIRAAVRSMAGWSLKVAALTRSLEAVGNVKGMLLAEEMYPAAMTDLAASRELGIPTIGVQHGTIMPLHMVYTPPVGHVREAPVPDYFAVFGDYAKKVVSEIGAYPKQRVWVTGAARFDHLAGKAIHRGEAREALGLPSDAQIILVTTQTYSWYPVVVRAVLEAAQSRPEWLVCLKIHPKRIAMKTGAYESLVADIGLRNVRLFEDHFEQLLVACNVIVSTSSTTLLEASLCDRTAICANFSAEPDRYPYVEDGGALGARSPAELERHLVTALDAEPQDACTVRRQEFLSRHAGPAMQGLAATTLAGNIANVIDNEERPRTPRGRQ